MQSCWESEPENRPQFSELVSTISSILESAAGYLELTMPLQDNESEFPGVETKPGDDKPWKLMMPDLIANQTIAVTVKLLLLTLTFAPNKLYNAGH